MLGDPPVQPPAEPQVPASTGVPTLILPMALVVIALFVWAGFQTIQLIRDRTTLYTLRANLETPFQESTKVRAQLESIARKTAELAAQGNAGAKLIVDELRKRGISINPTQQVPSPPPAAPTK